VREIALHLLDIAENSIAAEAPSIEITVFEDLRNDRLTAIVQDDGRGLDADMAAMVSDPFVTTRRTRKVGLGIPLLKAAAEACQGNLRITSMPGKGTRLEVFFQHSHIDRMPVGDLPGTILTLVVAYPTIRWRFRYRVVIPGMDRLDPEYEFDSQPVIEILGDLPLSEPDVLAYLRKELEQGVGEIQQALPELV
jgi:Histidine kinase-, DNA gyrase B-, and HSP90-like ATPase